jgi:hypothetical protein
MSSVLIFWFLINAASDVLTNSMEFILPETFIVAQLVEIKYFSLLLEPEG